MNILEKIVAKTQIRVNELKKTTDINELRDNAYKKESKAFIFEEALKKKEMAFICEIKKASPSKGIIAQDFPYISIAKEYEAIGADAVSILTEPDFFLGSRDYLNEISQVITTPILRKDFITDEIQIYESKLIGANAILLICSILDEETLKDFITIADSLGLSCLIEAHSEEEIEKALKAKARIIGVNNRDLKTFETDINTSVRLRKQVPKEIIFVSESGIKTREDIKILKENEVNAVLIGETFMRERDKMKALKILKGEWVEN